MAKKTKAATKTTKTTKTTVEHADGTATTTRRAEVRQSKADKISAAREARAVSGETVEALDED